MLKKTFLTSSLLLIASLTLSAQKEKIQTAFIYTIISKYVEWPESSRNGDFVIGVLGNSSIINELNDLSENRKIGGQSIIVKKFKTAGEISACHVLYVSDSKINEMDEAVSNAGNTLIITSEAPAVTKGNAVNFIEVNGKQSFWVKPQNATKKGLVMSPELAKMIANNG
jgi:Fe-S cluster assembly iron-binding protein IscA